MTSSGGMNLARLRLALLVCVAAGVVGLPAAASAAITSATAVDQSPTESTTPTLTVGSFTTDTPSDTFTATIDWGDGNTSLATVSQVGATDTFDVSGSHNYAEDGIYPTLSFTVTETGTSPDVQTSNLAVARVHENAFTLSVKGPINVAEGTQFSGPVAIFKDPGAPADPSAYTATIDWGDGTAPSPGVITGPDANGFYAVSGTHTYADEIASGQYSVTVSEPEANFLDFGPVSTDLTVSEADSLTATPTTISATDGTAFSGDVATFSDTDTDTPAGDFTATIDWGDGTSSAGVVSGSAGSFTVSGSHTYSSPPGSYPVTVTLSDDSPGTATATANSTANVSADEPTTTTQGASGIGTASATLHGTINPNGDNTTYFFKYGPDTNYGSVIPLSPADAGSGTSGVPVSGVVSGLDPGTTYHFELVATNGKGTTDGGDQTFTTIAAPSAA
ncbi:MAG: hypothetical protein ACJ764_12450, partial [Solirubrobacteraceae bacterium]